MDALLILGGLLLIVAGLVWLIVLAFGTSLLWGVGSLLPPVAVVYAVRHWGVARKAIGLSALGFIPLVVGVTLLASHDPSRVEAIASLDWLKSDSQVHTSRLAIRLNGQLDGRPFSPQIGKLTDGMLRLSDGDELFAQQAVSIRFGPISPGGVQIDVLPQDPDPVPEVEISWMQPEQHLPEARLIQSGYTLHLNLKPVPPNKLAGDFHLVLPAHYNTSLSGHIEVFTDDLRYRAGQVDLTHESADTLRYLARDHLQRRFQTQAVEVTSLSPVNFSKPIKSLSVKAMVKGVPDQYELAIAKDHKGWAVDDDMYPPLPIEHEVIPQIAASQAEPNPVSASSPRIDRRQRFSIDRLQRNPSHYDHLLMRAHTERGGVAEGRFVGIDRDGNVAIRQVLKGPGEAIYNLAPNDIVLLELLEP
ncbi:MFS transporter [Stutzerimonas zhaodongensis]|uniref:MFS transporter n=1 Tax=Stutzerimonas zhaodongensis TaxID=1176257 RepID=A0A3M2HXF6_9GAMM|nr:MFS transporter [Stutzerimonas zhaodongensis]MCQ4314584.1 MFS transporter [Stutzerimonas zhaodongensis]RMH92099.1 MFS transporter [Stutzerimonas zhaodongensis]